MKHYLDYNATAPMRPQVAAVMQDLAGLPLNPSSVHAAGRQAKAILEMSRQTLAQALGTFPNEIVFTGSGSEANNWVLQAFRDAPVLVSAIEHVSLYKTAKAQAMTFIPVTADGMIDLAALEKLLPKEGRFLACVMLANNETGILQPVREAADIVHTRGGLLHCDAVQALGKIPLDFTALGCDLMTVSAHKMGGPVGAAALVIRNALALPPLLLGGGQESNRRAGTENVAAIAGFAKAEECIDLPSMRQLRVWLDAFETEAEAAGGVIVGKQAARLPNTSCIMLPGMSAETQLIRLDLDGIAVSAGSACSSGRVEPSHVLAAMNAEGAASAIRVSGGWATTEQDIIALTHAWKRMRHNVQTKARAS